MNSLSKALVGLSVFIFALSGVTAEAQSKAKKKKTSEAASATEAAATGSTPAAPGAAIEGVKVAPGETLNFSVSPSDPGPAAGQTAPMFTFTTDPSKPAPVAPAQFSDALPEDTPFRTYIGYPKHRFSALVAPKSVGAIWNYKGLDFNFRSTSLAYGVGYDFTATPRLNIGVEYSHYTLKTDAAVVSPYRITSSNAAYDVYLAKARYCFFGSSNFFNQICPGFLIGNDSYPILAFTNATDLKIDKVQDVVAGVNVGYQAPITDKINFRAELGYNMGLGIGNSGTATSKGNSSYYLRLGAGWELNSHHALGTDVDWQNRSAKLKDKHSNVSDEWTTKSTDLGLRLLYTYTL